MTINEIVEREVRAAMRVRSGRYGATEEDCARAACLAVAKAIIERIPHLIYDPPATIVVTDCREFRGECIEAGGRCAWE